MVLIHLLALVRWPLDHVGTRGFLGFGGPEEVAREHQRSGVCLRQAKAGRVSYCGTCTVR